MQDNDTKIKDLKSKIKSIKDKESKVEKLTVNSKEDSESMNTGLRAGAELITSIAAGGLIGYGLDQWLETKPIFLIAMLLLGVITGFVNVWRTTQDIGYKVGYKDQYDTKQEK